MDKRLEKRTLNRKPDRLEKRTRNPAKARQGQCRASCLHRPQDAKAYSNLTANWITVFPLFLPSLKPCKTGKTFTFEGTRHSQPHASGTCKRVSTVFLVRYHVSRCFQRVSCPWTPADANRSNRI